MQLLGGEQEEEENYPPPLQLSTLPLLQHQEQKDTFHLILRYINITFNDVFVIKSSNIFLSLYCSETKENMICAILCPQFPRLLVMLCNHPNVTSFCNNKP